MLTLSTLVNYVDPVNHVYSVEKVILKEEHNLTLTWANFPRINLTCMEPIQLALGQKSKSTPEGRKTIFADKIYHEIIFKSLFCC